MEQMLYLFQGKKKIGKNTGVFKNLYASQLHLIYWKNYGANHHGNHFVNIIYA